MTGPASKLGNLPEMPWAKYGTVWLLACENTWNKSRRASPVPSSEETPHAQ